MSIIGAIRWDPWYAWSTAVSGQNQREFSVSGFQSRAPWFAQVISPYLLKAIGTQANVDTECQMAATAGLDYWAFVNYQSGSIAYTDTEMQQAWNYYQASPNKNLIKWCWITQEPQWRSATFSDNTWQPFLNNIATTQCTQANYQKVLGNRPLVFVLNVTGSVNTANMATAITYFRGRCTAAGLGTPYMVMQTDDNARSTLAARATACGFDAVANYGLPFLTEYKNTIAGTGSFDILDTSMQSAWASQASFGKVIPTGCTGWDTRCRIRAPIDYTAKAPWVGDSCYWATPTPARVAQHVQSLMNFVAANPAACDAQAALIYSWTECTEGSVRQLIPTLGDPPVAGGTNLLNAIKTVLRP